jgi:phosphoribosylamine--glycine ligase
MEGSLAVRPGAAVGVVVASDGYPEAPVTGLPLSGVEPSGPGEAGPGLCFHAGTRRDGPGYASAGGRVVTVVGLGADLAGAREVAYRGVAGVGLAGSRHRTDIGLREVAG